jgi:peptide/nickel transport system permease protein
MSILIKTDSVSGPARRARGRRFALPVSRSTFVGLLLVAVNVVVALAAPLLAPYAPTQPDALSAIEGPSGAHLLGTDQLGRDVLSRVLYGGRYAMLISLSATVLTVVIGTILGCLAAYRRGWLDEVLMRILDSVLSVPAILALLVVVTALGSGAPVIILAATVVYCPALIRVVRAAALSIVGLDYVTAARARGEGFWPVLVRELWPNILDVVMVEFAMRASWIVLLISSLSFLGFGANPPTPDWGLMVSENRSLLTVVPMATVAPIVALASLIIGLNLAADGIAKARGIDRITGGLR